MLLDNGTYAATNKYIKPASSYPRIDNATRKSLEEMLESARLYREMEFVRRELRTVRSYEMRVHGRTNVIVSPTEECAVWNTDREERMRQVSESVERAVSCLGQVEQDIIRRRYLERESIFDYQIHGELNLSERTYRRIKARALEKLALLLGLADLDTA